MIRLPEGNFIASITKLDQESPNPQFLSCAPSFGIGTLLAIQALVCLFACLISSYLVATEYFADFGVFLGIAFTLFSFGRSAYKSICKKRWRKQ